MNEMLTARVTCAGDSEALKKIAKKKGIILPSDHLGAFKTVYARIGDANKNNVRLSRQAVVDALPSLLGSQVNINHWRQNWTIGSIFWAKVNENDEIEIAFTFFKDVYVKEFEIAMALFDKGELTVSFELTADPDTIEYHKDGTRTLNTVSFVGCGLLLDENPAEPSAIVFEMAKRQVMELIHNDTSELVFAKKAVVSCQDLLETINTALKDKEDMVANNKYQCECLKCGKIIESTKHCKDIKCSCGGEMRRKDRPGSGDKASEEELNSNLDLPKEEANKHRDEVKEKNINEDLEEGGNETMVDKKKKDLEKEVKVVEEIETKVDEKADEADKSTKEKVVEPEAKVEPKAEEKVEDKADAEGVVEEQADLEIVTKVDRVITETMDENSDTVEVDSEVTRTVKRDGEVVSEEKSEMTEKTTYTFAEVEDIKAGYETTIEELKASLEAKDSEMETAKESAVKIEKLRAELGEYVKDFSDEDFENKDKLENARLKKENDSLKANVSSEEEVPEAVKEEASKVKVVKASLETGHEEKPEATGSPLVRVLKRKR